MPAEPANTSASDHTVMSRWSGPQADRLDQLDTALAVLVPSLAPRAGGILGQTAPRPLHYQPSRAPDQRQSSVLPVLSDSQKSRINDVHKGRSAWA